MRRVAEGEEFCGHHGGKAFERKYIDNLTVAPNQRLYRYRLLVEDTFVHLHRCPVCRLQAIAKPLWTQSKLEIEATSANCCAEGRRLCGLVAEALTDLGPRRILSPNRPADHVFIGRMILHVRSCKICRPERDDSAIWDWSDYNRRMFSLCCCPTCQNILDCWEDTLLTKRAA